MSTNPGATARSLASMTRVAGSSTSPTATMRPSRTPTSPTRARAPVPSTIVPPRSTVSNIGCSPSSCLRWRGERHVAVDRAAPHQPVARVMVVQRDVHGATLVPDREVVDGPVPARTELGLGRVLHEEGEQLVALVAAHADDLVHPVPGQEQRVAA